MANGKSTSQVQNSFEIWNNLVDAQLTQLNASYKQISEMQKFGQEQNVAALETTAKFVKESMDFAGKVSAEWTQMSLDTNKRNMEMFRTKE
jgi:hypothetical protein